LLLSIRSLARDPSIAIPLLALVTALPFFFIGGPDWMSGPLFRAVWDLGHIGFFALLLMLIQSRHPLDTWQKWLWVTLIVFSVGGAIEYLQTKVGRDGNWGDVLGNLTGAWLGLFWFQKSNWRVWLGRIAACILLIFPLLTVGRLALLQYQSAQLFPLLCGFENPRDFTRWDGNLEPSTEQVTQGKYSAKVTLGTSRFAKAALRQFFGDWSRYETLAFDIYNPDTEPLTMTLRVHDARHELGNYAHTDRFNTRILVEPGWNHFSFSTQSIAEAPEGRQMEMSLIRGVEIFTSGLTQERVIYLDNLRLE
jgi:Predicted integral membrane protein